MTEADPAPSGNGPHRRVWRLAGPIILANLSVPLLGAVDTAVLGHLEAPRFLGGVAVATAIFSFIYWGFGFLRMGTTGLAAQAHGAGEMGEVAAVLARAVLWAVALGMLVWALQIPVLRLSLALFEASSGVEGEAAIYFRIRVWSAPAVLINYCLLGWFIGVQNTRAALALQVLMNGINIVLDLVFVVGLGMETAGVAAATVISECTAVFAGAWLVRRQMGGRVGPVPLARLLDRARMARMGALNRDIFIRTFVLIFAFVFFTAEGAKLGEVTLAANAILMQFQYFLAFGLDGFAHAAEALVGGALGASNRDALRSAIRVSGIWALGVAVLYAAIYWIAGGFLVDLLTGLEAVRAAAKSYLPWVVLSPLLSVWSYMLDGIFIGATRSREMRNAMVLSVALYVPCVWALKAAMGNHGLWLALMIFMVLRALTLAAYLRRIERPA